MPISGSAQKEGQCRVQVAPRMQQSANPWAQRIKPPALQTPQEGSGASEALRWVGFRGYGNRTISQPPQRTRRRPLNLRGGPVGNPSLTLQKSPARSIGAGATAEVRVN
jgi:hypothetical protein